ncbi:sarcosine oxidase subunit gamma [Aureimonas sp. AU20]|uniref:sarcosine oxidase subunit gamma n=1 Tax=Aureimonas sp. AU20 TaxID=1349819 RepID=UPI0009E8194A|nr:sarcosine oxidase subunit gamma family protein [Aureimonas sp. AU20]
MLDAVTVSAGPAPVVLPFGRPSAPVLIEALPPQARFVLRLRNDAGFPKVAELSGVALPREACRFAENGSRRAIWLGPDEWLLVAPYAEAGHLFDGLEQALAEIPHSLVEVSHRSLGYAISGREAASVLAAGCPLDLDQRAFPIGMATRTVLAKTEIILQRTGGESFQLDVWRSFANYTLGYLIEAARSYG